MLLLRVLKIDLSYVVLKVKHSPQQDVEWFVGEIRRSSEVVVIVTQISCKLLQGPADTDFWKEM